jgi:hypothetical protein
MLVEIENVDNAKEGDVSLHSDDEYGVCYEFESLFALLVLRDINMKLTDLFNA